MEITDLVPLEEILSQKQKPEETTSSFIFRIFAQAGDQIKHISTEKLIASLLRNMNQRVADYLNLKGLRRNNETQGSSKGI